MVQSLRLQTAQEIQVERQVSLRVQCSRKDLNEARVLPAAGPQEQRRGLQLHQADKAPSA